MLGKCARAPPSPHARTHAVKWCYGDRTDDGNQFVQAGAESFGGLCCGGIEGGRVSKSLLMLIKSQLNSPTYQVDVTVGPYVRTHTHTNISNALTIKSTLLPTRPFDSTRSIDRCLPACLSASCSCARLVIFQIFQWICKTSIHNQIVK